MLQKNDVDILNTICKNSRMAYDSTKQVIGKCRDKELGEYLKSQKNRYADAFTTARKRLEDAGLSPRSVPVMQSAMAQIGIALKTAVNNDRSHIAELMYDGTNMGIIDIARSVNHSSHAAQETISLAKDLLSGEEKYADGLRKFL